MQCSKKPYHKPGADKFALRLRVALVIVLWIMTGVITVRAQSTSTRVELVARTDETVWVHVRIPRGQAIDSAQVTQDESSITLEVSDDPLPETHWLILDASQHMLDLQSAAGRAAQRLLRNADEPMGVITFDNSIRTLQPTTLTTEIDDFLQDYTASPDKPACLWQALAPLAENERDLNRSWRILLITAGNFADQSDCEISAAQNLPAPVDVITTADEIDPLLQTIIDDSEGDLFQASSLTIDARVTEVRARWGEATYLLSGEWSSDWDQSAPFDLNITLDNGENAAHTLTVRTYQIAVEPARRSTPDATNIVPSDTQRPPATETESATVVPTEVPATSTARPATTAVPDATADDAERDLTPALVLVVGMVVVGAAIIAFGFIRTNRIPAAPISDEPENFYDTLDPAEPKKFVGDDPETEKIIVDANETHKMSEETRNPDDILITQVLSDARFRMMIDQSLNESGVVAWLRLEGPTTGDYAVSRSGLLIGRSQECDIQITGDSAISRNHVRIDVLEDDTVTISRLSIVNPVVVGGKQIGNRHPLEPNNVVHLSDRTRLIFILKHEDLE